MSGATAVRRVGKGLLVAGLVLIGSLLLPGGVAHAETGTVTSGGLRIRDAMWGTVIGSLPTGSQVRINARARDPEGNGWYYVTTANGSVGWVYAEYVRNAGDAQARVGIQAGHWRYKEAAYPLNVDPGSVLPGFTEEETNLTIALILSRRLSAREIAVDLLPTTIPPGYKADAVVSIHSDAGPSYVRGFFVDRPPRSPVAAAEAALARELIASHARTTGIPYIRRSTEDSRNYYGFRAVDAMTPIVLIEVGCLTNAEDRAIIAGRPAVVADALAPAIASFLFR